MTHSMFRICQIKYPETVFHGQAVRTVAYLRVSTPQQDVGSQRLAILEYARKHDFRIDDFIEATASGQASEKRRRLDELMHVLQRGDRLVVSELSRLGRSLGQIVAILDALAKAGVAFVAMKENIRIEGKRDIQTKVMTTLFALFAEVERDLISRAHPRGPRQGQGLGPEARASERRAGCLTAQRQGGRHPALPQAGRFQDRHRRAHGRVPYDPLQLHEDPRAQAEPLACISACAVRRRHSAAGANPARKLSLQPVAIGADGWRQQHRLKHSDGKGPPRAAQRPYRPQRE